MCRGRIMLITKLLITSCGSIRPRGKVNRLNALKPLTSSGRIHTTRCAVYISGSQAL